jgi:hypothetical protein
MYMYNGVGEELAFSTSGLSSAGVPESALRFGLMDIQPMQVVDTIKKFGVKFKRITTKFQSLKPSQSYSDLVYFENEAIFGSIEVPEWFDANRLIKTYSERSIQRYKKDEELQREIEKIRKAKRIGRPLLSFTQFVIEKFQASRERYLESEAHRFLNSNLPLSFYNKLVVSDNTYYDFLRIVEDIVRMCEFRAETSRNFDMYTRNISIMKKQLSPLIDQMDKCCFAESRLKRYVSIWNSKDYGEVLYPKFLDIGKVDFSTFEQLSEDYNTRLKEVRECLLHHNQKILRKERDLKDPTTKMLSKLVMLPQSSYRLES